MDRLMRWRFLILILACLTTTGTIALVLITIGNPYPNMERAWSSLLSYAGGAFSLLSWGLFWFLEHRASDEEFLEE